MIGNCLKRVQNWKFFEKIFFDKIQYKIDLDLEFLYLAYEASDKMAFMSAYCIYEIIKCVMIIN